MKPIALTRRVEAFFLANPTEELSYEDMAHKFGVEPRQARDAVKTLRMRKLPPVRVLHVVRIAAPVDAA